MAGMEGGGPTRGPFPRDKMDDELDKMLGRKPHGPMVAAGGGGDLVPPGVGTALDYAPGSDLEPHHGGTAVALLERDEPKAHDESDDDKGELKSKAGSDLALRDSRRTGDLVSPSPEDTIPVPELKGSEDPLRIVLASLDQNVDAYAREAAHEQVNKKIEGPFWKRIAKSVWHNLTREYQVVKATKEAREEILENDNLRHHQGAHDAAWREGVINRYGSEYAEHMIHDGESFHKLDQAEAARDPNAERIRSDVQELMRQVARGEVADDDSLKMMEDRMVETWRSAGISQDFIGEGQLLASNVGRKARELEGMVNSAEGLSEVERNAMIEEVLSKIEITTGEARVGANTEIDSTFSERMAEKLRKVPFLSEGRLAAVTSAVANETTIAAMMSGVFYAAKRGAALAGKVVMPGIGAGIVAGIRERNALIDERALEERRSDAGHAPGEVPDDSSISTMRRLLKKAGIGKTSEEYRAELNATQYETRKAGDLIGALGDFYDESGELNIRDRAGLDRALDMIGQLEARNQLHYRRGARLIDFTDSEDGVEGMEDRRMQLDLAKAKLETDLRRLFGNPAAEAMLDIKPGEEFNDLVGMERAINLGKIKGEMDAQDKLFNKLVRQRVFKRVIATTLMGGAIGAGVKYGAEAARAVYDSVQETFADLFDAGQSMPDLRPAAFETNNPDVPGDHVGTDAEAPGDHVGGQTTAPGDHVGTGTGVPGEQVGGLPEGAEAGGASIRLSDTLKVTLPEGFKVDIQGEAITVTGPNGLAVEGLTLDQSGNLSDEEVALLRSTLESHGFGITDSEIVVPGDPEVTQTTVSAAEFAKNHANEMKKIHIQKWLNNNTARFDLNELRQDNYKDGNGNIVMSIARMTRDGSFRGNSGVDWKEAVKDGHMKFYLSASTGTQSQAFEFEIRPDGTAVVDKNHPAFALFNQDGEFIGGYQQAALNGGQTANGAENIAVLATVVGKHSPEFTNTTEKPTYEKGHHYSVYKLPEETASINPGPEDEEPPLIPFVPLTTRRRINLPDDQPPQVPVETATALSTEPTPPAADSPELPTLPAAQQRAAGKLPAAPTLPTIDTEAARRAATMGLPAAPEAPAVDAGDTASRESEDRAAEGMTDEERAFLGLIDAQSPDISDVPLRLGGGALDGLNDRQRRFAAMLLRQATERNPQKTGETDGAYDIRMTSVIRAGASLGATRLPYASPAMQALMRPVFTALTNARVGGVAAGAAS